MFETGKNYFYDGKGKNKSLNKVKAAVGATLAAAALSGAAYGTGALNAVGLIEDEKQGMSGLQKAAVAAAATVGLAGAGYLGYQKLATPTGDDDGDSTVDVGSSGTSRSAGGKKGKRRKGESEGLSPLLILGVIIVVLVVAYFLFAGDSEDETEIIPAGIDMV